jgi:hypothetical protein
MTLRTRKVAVFVGTAALAASAGIGVAAQGSSSAATESRSAPGMMRGGDGMSTLADDLGVTETRLREAMDSLRTAGRPDDLTAALADELGVSEDKVRDALENAPPQGGGPPPDGTTSQSPPPCPAAVRQSCNARGSSTENTAPPSGAFAAPTDPP